MATLSQDRIAPEADIALAVGIDAGAEPPADAGS
jgi:hypothetical protein